MAGFEITSEGWIRDVGIHEAALRHQKLFPHVDIATFEASTLLIRVLKAIREGGEPDLAQLGLTPSRLPVLETIHRSDSGRLTIREIAEALRVTPTNISKLVDGLESEGWVTRMPNAADGRSTFAELTEWGRNQLEAIVSVTSARRMDTWSVLTTEEKQILAHLLAKLYMNVLSRRVKPTEVLRDYGGGAAAR